METALIYCDGAYSSLIKKGGYGVVIIKKKKTLEFFESFEGHISSSRAEMLAAIRGIEVCAGFRIRLYSDAKFLIDGMTTYLDRDYKANNDLWKKLRALNRQYMIEWIWQKGHDGDKGNERAHELAYQAIWE